MKRVAVLGDTLVGGNTFGVQRFAFEILRELDVINPDMEIVVLVPQKAKVDIQFKNIKIVKYGNISNSFLWRQICFPAFIKKYDYVGLDMTLGLPFLGCDVVCLHDCTYEKFDDNFSTFKEKVRRFSYLLRAKRLTKVSKRIVTVSEYSKEDLISYYRILPDKIEVIYNAWQHYNRVEADEDILHEIGVEKNEYYFSLGSGLKHKNLIWIVKAAINNPQEKFVITGSDKFSNYLNEIGIQTIKNVIYTGYIKDESVKGLMKNCKALILPSYCEGFGIPPLEALSIGANIIVSNTSCLPEIYGSSALYIDPYNYEITMDDYKNFPSEMEKSKVLRKYSWEDSAKKLLKVLEEAMG